MTRRWKARTRAKKNNKPKLDYKPRKRKERSMSKIELQTILGYINIGLAVAHNTGVTLGHFGGTDFIQLAESVNGLLLNAITPAAVVAPATPVTVTAVAVQS